MATAVLAWKVLACSPGGMQWRLLAASMRDAVPGRCFRLARSLGWQIGVVPLGAKVIRLACPICRTIELPSLITTIIRLKTPI